MNIHLREQHDTINKMKKISREEETLLHLLSSHSESFFTARFDQRHGQFRETGSHPTQSPISLSRGYFPRAYLPQMKKIFY